MLLTAVLYRPQLDRTVHVMSSCGRCLNFFLRFFLVDSTVVRFIFVMKDVKVKKVDIK